MAVHEAFNGGMELAAVEKMAWEHLTHFGLSDWSFSFDRAKRRAGQTNFTRRTITLSKHIASIATRDQVRDTILHEIAHALVGPGHGHDKVWKAAARRVGARPAARGNFPVVEGRWVAVCPAGHRHTRHRKPTGKMSCGSCSIRYSDAHRLYWIDTSTLKGG